MPAVAWLSCRLAFRLASATLAPLGGSFVQAEPSTPPGMPTTEKGVPSVIASTCASVGFDAPRSVKRLRSSALEVSAVTPFALATIIRYLSLPP